MRIKGIVKPTAIAFGTESESFTHGLQKAHFDTCPESDKADLVYSSYTTGKSIVSHTISTIHKYHKPKILVMQDVPQVIKHYRDIINKLARVLMIKNYSIQIVKLNLRHFGANNTETGLIIAHRPWIPIQLRLHNYGLASNEKGYLTNLGQWFGKNVFDLLSIPSFRNSKPEMVLVDLTGIKPKYENFTEDYSPISYSQKRKTLIQLSCDIRSCNDCPRMHLRRRVLTQTNGNVNAKVLFVGEAPGKSGADKYGMAFYGDPSGKNFEELLKHIDLTYDDVFTTNAVLCNPREQSNNDKPNTEEIHNCSKWFTKTLETIDPKVIVTMGATALRLLNNIKPHDIILSKSVARMQKWNGYVLVPMYHPSPRVINSHRSMDKMKKDFEKLRGIINH